MCFIVLFVGNIALNVSLAVSVVHCCSLFFILLVLPLSSSSRSSSFALFLSPSLLFPANLFFAFYCLSLPALLWPVKLSPLTKWLMTKVNSPTTLYLSLLTLHLVDLSFQRFPSSGLMKTCAAWLQICLCL